MTDVYTFWPKTRDVMGASTGGSEYFREGRNHLATYKVALITLILQVNWTLSNCFTFICKNTESKQLWCDFTLRVSGWGWNCKWSSNPMYKYLKVTINKIGRNNIVLTWHHGGCWNRLGLGPASTGHRYFLDPLSALASLSAFWRSGDLKTFYFTGLKRSSWFVDWFFS